MIKTQSLINGKWIDAKDGGKIVVISGLLDLKCSVGVDISNSDPATDAELGSVPELGLAETKQAISAAAEAFKSWSTTTAKVC